MTKSEVVAQKSETGGEPAKAAAVPACRSTSTGLPPLVAIAWSLNWVKNQRPAVREPSIESHASVESNRYRSVAVPARRLTVLFDVLKGRPPRKAEGSAS